MMQLTCFCSYFKSVY